MANDAKDDTKRRTIELRLVDMAGIEALTAHYLGGMAANVRAVAKLSETDVIRLAIADACARHGLRVDGDAGEEGAS